MSTEIDEERGPDDIDTQPTRPTPRRRHGSAPGEYPWDDWQRRALAAGVSVALAELGRAVMREADQHVWDPEVQAECGWCDAGETMIARALDAPDATHARWRWLLDTDGAAEA